MMMKAFGERGEGGNGRCYLLGSSLTVVLVIRVVGSYCFFAPTILLPGGREKETSLVPMKRVRKKLLCGTSLPTPSITLCVVS